MININYGRNKELLEDCKPLGEYSWFVEKTRTNRKNGMSIKDAVDAALDKMPDDFLIKPYLLQNREEVEIMCITEYNEEETYEIYGERCEARGKAEGEAKGIIKAIVGFFKDGLISEKDAAKRANMSLEDFRKAEALYCN